MMKLISLSPLSIVHLYCQRIRRDFPLAERRPLLSILRLHRKGFYSVFSALDGAGKAVGYAAVAVGKNGALLLDYLAVNADCRGKGVGSKLLSQLAKHLPYAPLFVEAEDPDEAPTAALREVCRRRIRFYQKNGFEQTPLRCRLFGVGYRILLLHPVEDSRQALEEIYHTLFSDAVYRQNVHFR